MTIDPKPIDPWHLIALEQAHLHGIHIRAEDAVPALIASHHHITARVARLEELLASARTSSQQHMARRLDAEAALARASVAAEMGRSLGQLVFQICRLRGFQGLPFPLDTAGVADHLRDEVGELIAALAEVQETRTHDPDGLQTAVAHAREELGDVIALAMNVAIASEWSGIDIMHEAAAKISRRCDLLVSGMTWAEIKASEYARSTPFSEDEIGDAVEVDGWHDVPSLWESPDGLRFQCARCRRLISTDDGADDGFEGMCSRCWCEIHGEQIDDADRQLGDDETAGWRDERHDLPTIGEWAEVKLATGEIVRGKVGFTRMFDGFIKLIGKESAPLVHRPEYEDGWATTTDCRSPTVRRVAWRYAPRPAEVPS